MAASRCSYLDTELSMFVRPKGRVNPLYRSLSRSKLSFSGASPNPSHDPPALLRSVSSAGHGAESVAVANTNHPPELLNQQRQMFDLKIDDAWYELGVLYESGSGRPKNLHV